MQLINSATLIEFIMLAQVCQFNLVNVEALVAFFWHVVGKMKICGVFESLLTRLSVESVLKKYEFYQNLINLLYVLLYTNFYFIFLSCIS